MLFDSLLLICSQGADRTGPHQITGNCGCYHDAHANQGFNSREGLLAPRLAGHAVNPALQPILTRIPMITQAMAYAEGDAYEYGRATRAAAHQVLGQELGDLVVRNLLWLQDIGREKLEPAAEARLRARFSEHDHPGAREILAWLDGYWRVTREDFDGA